MKQSWQERFDDRWIPEPNTGCWLWTATSLPTGYGNFRIPGKSGGPGYTHRIAYERWVSPIPKGMHVLHKCDTPACINPDHLFVGTPLDNSRDKFSKGRGQEGDRHWARKHPEYVRRGERNGNAILTESDVLNIIDLVRVQGMVQARVAEMYKVSNAQISMIVNGKRWKVK